MKNGDKQTQPTIPTGPMMMMRALGLDPAAIMQNVESAKATATQVMQHFERRLNVIEGKIDELLSRDGKAN